MLDKNCSKLMDTICERDYKSRHYWERRGIVESSGKIYTVWQCTQCTKCILEKLSFIE